MPGSWAGGEPGELERIRQLPRWAAGHVRNRTLPIIIFLSVIAASVAGLVCLAFAIQAAAEAGAPGGLQIACLTGAAAVFAWLLWFRFVVGRRMSRALANLISGGRGQAEMAASEEELARLEQPSLAHLAVLAALLAWAILFLAGVIPPRYEQPTLATILVPCLLYFYGFRHRGFVSPFLLLWPALYGIHAVLLVAGVPIYISGGPGGIYHTLNLILPTLGYGLAAAVAGQSYSWYARRRLSALARGAEEGGAAGRAER